VALYVTLSSSTVPRAQVMTHFLYDPHQGANHGANFGPLSSALLLDLINVILRQCPTSSGHLPTNFAALGPFSCVPTHGWDVQCLPLIIHSASRAECKAMGQLDQRGRQHHAGVVSFLVTYAQVCKPGQPLRLTTSQPRQPF
jgi:hypothetical protein